MSFRSKVAGISSNIEATSSNSQGTSSNSQGTSSETKKPEPRYIFLGFFAHGLYDYRTKPYQANEHASLTMETLRSVPKLMTFMNCSPGTSLIGEIGGVDNAILKDYFKKNSDFDIMDTSEFYHPKAKTDEQLLSYNLLSYINSGLDELDMNPRSKTELFKSANPTDIDVCRNSFICSDKIGISHDFLNKSFAIYDASTPSEDVYNWGIYIYNNNCGIHPGTNILTLHEIEPIEDYDKDGKFRGYIYYLDDIIKGLTKIYGLTEDDYLFLFDYSCNNFSKTSINQQKDPRLNRRLGNEVANKFGFSGKKGGTKKINKFKRIKHKTLKFKNHKLKTLKFKNHKLKTRKLETRKLEKGKSARKNKRK